MNKTQDSHRAVHSLEDWLAVATAGLCEEVRQGLSERFRAEGEGRDDAVTALGDPQAANRHYRRRYLTDWEKALFMPRPSLCLPAPPLPSKAIALAFAYFAGLPMAILGFIVGTTTSGIKWGILWAVVLGCIGWGIAWATVRIGTPYMISSTLYDPQRDFPLYFPPLRRPWPFLATVAQCLFGLLIVTLFLLNGIHRDAYDPPVSLFLFAFLFVCVWPPVYIKMRLKVFAFLTALTGLILGIKIALYGFEGLPDGWLAIDLLLSLVILVWCGLAGRSCLKLGLFGMPQAGSNLIEPETERGSSTAR